MSANLPQDMSDQLAHAMYLPAIFPPYAKAAIAPATHFRKMPGALVPSDLNFFNLESKLFYLPVALYSAGHETNFCKPSSNMVTRRVRKNAMVFGDSGGYQILSGNLNPTTDQERADIFHWQNCVCDFAMTLDVPTASIDHPNSNYLDFDSCLRATLCHLSSFKQLYDRAENPPKLLNVLQGRNRQEADTWYDAVKRFEFNGWAFAGPLKANLCEVVRRILILWREEKLGGGYEWLHFLGIGDLQTACLLTAIRDGIRHILQTNEFDISFDTSSPFLSMGRYNTVFSKVVMDGTRFAIETADFPVGGHRYLGSPEPFPYQTSPIGQLLTMGDLIVKKRNIAKSRVDNLGLYMLMNHNIYVTASAILTANRVMAMHRAEARQYAPYKLLDAKAAIDDIFHAQDPHATFNRHERLLNNFRAPV